MKLLLILSMFFVSSYAADVIDDPELLYQMPVNESGALGKKVTVNWKFNSFGDFISTLQKNYGVNSELLSTEAKPSTAIQIYLNNGSLEQLITQASNKFGYTWTYRQNVVIFRALHPVANSNPGTKAGQYAWSLSPADKTLRSALSKWCKVANWQLIWNVHADYPITTSWRISGSFETAVNEVLKASQETDVPLLAIMHDSNHVLEIGSPVANVK